MPRFTLPPATGPAEGRRPAAARSTEQLIDELALELAPVRRLWAPGVRAGAWLAAVGALALILAAIADLPALKARLAVDPDMWLAVVGSTATAVLAALAAFELSLPAPRRWRVWLPLPALALWLGASGFGCLRSEPMSNLQPAMLADATVDCLPFIVGVSIPLSVLLLLMLRRAHPLRPEAVALMGGLASAAAAASLLAFVHPYDASAADLLVHIVAVLLVLGLNRLAASRAFG